VSPVLTFGVPSAFLPEHAENKNIITIKEKNICFIVYALEFEYQPHLIGAYKLNNSGLILKVLCWEAFAAIHSIVRERVISKVTSQP